MNKQKLISSMLFGSVFVLTLSACSGSTSGSDQTTNTGTGGGDNSGASNPPASTTTVDSKINQSVGNHLNKVDYFIPSNADKAVIFLHGGGGHKEPMEFDMEMKADDSDTDFTLTDSASTWLKSSKVMAVFPQGLTITGYNAWTWDNYVMDSGADDLSFLQDLVANIKADPKFAGIKKFYLVGHSNGGMMANRVWCEAPDLFDGYAAISGPASIHLDPTLASSSTNHPCAPSKVKPFISIVGNSDKVLQTTGNMSVATWTINPVLHLGRPPTWVDDTPKVINDISFYSVRTQFKCSLAPASPVVSGAFTTYSDCGGSLKLLIVAQTAGEGGDHCLTRLSGPCTSTLRGNTGLDYKQTLIDFFSKQ